MAIVEEITSKYRTTGMNKRKKKLEGQGFKVICFDQNFHLQSKSQMARWHENFDYILYVKAIIETQKDWQVDFFDLYQDQSMLALEVGHNGIVDWNIFVWERRGKQPGNWGDPVIQVTNMPSREEAFARAYDALKDYVDETRP